jgi:hypothetical protein
MQVWLYGSKAYKLSEYNPDGLDSVAADLNLYGRDLIPAAQKGAKGGRETIPI